MQWKNEGAFTYDRRWEFRRKVDDLACLEPVRGQLRCSFHTASGANNCVSIGKGTCFSVTLRFDARERRGWTAVRDLRALAWLAGASFSNLILAMSHDPPPLT
jgi:hypothetical protein